MQNTQRKLSVVSLFVFLVVAVLGACASDGNDLDDGLYARMTTNRGEIVLRLFYERAPLTVTNFVGLSEGTVEHVRGEGARYYDGLTFHRVVDEFVIQGGDPEGTGRGGPGYQFPDEFHPDLRHNKAGILSMANSGADTNGSQFFITLAPTPHLDDRHSVFGEVVEGMSVVRSIAQGDVMESVEIVRVGDAAEAFETDQDAFDGRLRDAGWDPDARERKRAEDLALIEETWPDAQLNRNGIYYEILEEGDGSIPGAGTEVAVHYDASVLGGSRFESTRTRPPYEFVVGSGRILPAIDEMVRTMRRGERRVFIVPPEQAFGSAGRPPVIPPDSFLVFDLELLDE